MIKDLYVRYREVISYLFWGVITTIVSWGSYTLFALLFKSEDNSYMILGLEVSKAVFLANLLSWICAVTFAFFTNKIWVFKSRSWNISVWIPEFVKFISARIITGILEIVLVPLLVSLGMNQTLFGVEGIISKVVVSILVVILNYVFSKLFIFKDDADKI